MSHDHLASLIAQLEAAGITPLPGANQEFGGNMRMPFSVSDVVNLIRETQQLRAGAPAASAPEGSTLSTQNEVRNALGGKAKTMPWTSILATLREFGPFAVDAQTGEFKLTGSDRGYAVAAAWVDQYRKLLGPVATAFGLASAAKFSAPGLPANHLGIAAECVTLLSMIGTLNTAMLKRGYGVHSDTFFRRVQIVIDRAEGQTEIASQLAVEAKATGLTFRQLQEANYRRCPEFGHTVEEWSPERWLMAVTGEVGEIASGIKKIVRGDKDAPTWKDIGYEIADSIIYLDLLASKCGINTGDVVAEKFNLVSQRKGSTVLLAAPTP